MPYCMLARKWRTHQKMKQKNENYPSALEAFFLIVLLMGIELLMNMVADEFKALTGVGPGQIEAVIMVLANAVLFTALLQYKQLSYGNLFHPSNQRVGATILLLAVPILLILPALELVMGLLDSFIEDWLPLSAGQERMFDEMLGSGMQSLITACLVAPVLEEMLFRGIILRSFLCQYSRRQAIWGSAILFGLAHLNIYQFVGATIIGACCAWLYEKSRSLWPGIFLHASSNAAALLFYQITPPNVSQANWELSDAMLLFILGLAGAGIFILHRLLPLDNASTKHE